MQPSNYGLKGGPVWPFYSPRILARHFYALSLMLNKLYFILCNEVDRTEDMVNKVELFCSDPTHPPVAGGVTLGEIVTQRALMHVSWTA